MDPTVLSAVIGGIAGLFAGIIASLIAPWVHWGVEKEKLRLAARRELIKTARLSLESISDRKEFRKSVIYSQIRSFVSEDTRIKIEIDKPEISLHVGGDGEITVGVQFKSSVLNDLEVLEKKWKLL